MDKTIWDEFVELYNTELIIKRVKMAEILEAFWCFAWDVVPERKERLKEIFGKYGIKVKR